MNPFSAINFHDFTSDNFSFMTIYTWTLEVLYSTYMGICIQTLDSRLYPIYIMKRYLCELRSYPNYFKVSYRRCEHFYEEAEITCFECKNQHKCTIEISKPRKSKYISNQKLRMPKSYYKMEKRANARKYVIKKYRYSQYNRN